MSKLKCKERGIAAVLLGVSVAVILWLTVFRRETVVEDAFAYHPFSSLLSFWSSIKKQGIRGNFLGNILIFIPIGILYPIAFGTVGDERKKYRTVLFGFALSLIVELSQLVFSKGYFDLDDILLNTLGAVIGFVIYATVLSEHLKHQ